ncbi:uncharacterized protein LOC142356941 isoform X2 [Convolutriloba macropyga]
MHYFTYHPHSGSSIHISALLDCSDETTSQWVVTVTISPPPNSFKLFHLTLKIPSYNITAAGKPENQSQMTTEVTVSGSSCKTISISSKCLFIFPAIGGEFDRAVLLDICLNDSCLPQSFLLLKESYNEEPQNHETASGASSVVIALSTVFGVILPISSLVIVVVVICKCRTAKKMKTEKSVETKENVYERPCSTLRAVSQTNYANPSLQSVIETDIKLMENSNTDDTEYPPSDKNCNRQCNVTENHYRFDSDVQNDGNGDDGIKTPEIDHNRISPQSYADDALFSTLQQDDCD